MPLHDFKGPVTGDKIAVFLKTSGITATSNLVKTVRDAADDDAVWTAVKAWAGNNDGSVTRLPAALSELPSFHAPPNRLNIEVYDGANQTVQVLGIAQTPDLDLTIALFDPGNNTDHATLAKMAENTLVDVLVLTATTWRASGTAHIDGASIECSGYAVLALAGKPYQPGGPAGETAKLTIPLAYRDVSPRIVASY